MIWPFESQADDFYGHPGNRHNPTISDKVWEANNLVTITPPFAMTYAGKPIPFFHIHRLCVDSVRDVLGHIWELAGHDYEKVQEWGATVFGGSYNYRLKRTTGELSMHAYGCAIDFDPVRNQLGSAKGHLNATSPVVKAFKAAGWEWGGDWPTTKDPMHFQAARTH